MKVKYKPWLSSHLEKQEVGQGDDLVRKSVYCASMTTWVQIPGTYIKSHNCNPSVPTTRREQSQENLIEYQQPANLEWTMDPASKQCGKEEPTLENCPLTSM